MIKPEQIPDEVVEKAAKAMYAAEPWSTFWSIEDARSLSRAAIAAAINAWPGMEIETVFVEEDYLILPLRKES